MEKIEPSRRVVVCDAGPLIHLDEVDCLDLLGDFAQVLVPSAVWEEVLRHRSTALEHPQASILRLNVSSGSPPPELAAVSRLFTLHTGELQALQLAFEQSVDFLLTDDTAARLAARHTGIPVHGTLGILLRSIRRNQRTAGEVMAILRSLPKVSSLHVKQTLIEEVIRAVEERR